MKKNTKRTRLQSLDAAQLAQVTGGLSSAEYYSVLVDWAAACYPTGLNSWFFAGGIAGATQG
jgi:hypothetical protein